MSEQHWSEALNRWMAPTEYAKLVAHVARLEQRVHELETREARRGVLERVREWAAPVAGLSKRIGAIEDEARHQADLERIARSSAWSEATQETSDAV